MARRRVNRPLFNGSAYGFGLSSQFEYKRAPAQIARADGSLVMVQRSCKCGCTFYSNIEDQAFCSDACKWR